MCLIFQNLSLYTVTIQFSLINFVIKCVVFQLYTFTVIPAVSTLMATFGICNSVPPTPPSSSAAADLEVPFKEGFKMVFLLNYVSFLSSIVALRKHSVM